MTRLRLALVVLSLSVFACAFLPASYVVTYSPKSELVNALFSDDFLRHNVDSWLPMIETGKPR